MVAAMWTCNLSSLCSASLRSHRYSRRCSMSESRRQCTCIKEARNFTHFFFLTPPESSSISMSPRCRSLPNRSYVVFPPPNPIAPPPAAPEGVLAMCNKTFFSWSLWLVFCRNASSSLLRACSILADKDASSCVVVDDLLYRGKDNESLVLEDRQEVLTILARWSTFSQHLEHLLRPFPLRFLLQLAAFSDPV
jgi:hypothetical protein